MPMGYLRNLKAVRKRMGLTQAELAERVGVEQPTIQRYERGRSPTIDQALEIADALGVTIGDLVDEATSAPLGPRLFVKGEVQAGVFKEAWELEADEWEVFTGRADVSAPVQSRFGLRTVGESMSEVYPPGTVLECIAYDGGYPIPNGKRVIVQRRCIDGTVETTVKELVRDGDGVEWLVPRSLNPAFQTPFRADQPEEGVERVEIIALVVGSYRPE